VTVAFTQHAASPFYSAQGSELLVGGVTLSELVRRIGHTPFYV
jgi:hypothetical protein